MAMQPDQIFSVEQLTRRVKTLLERGVGAVWVAGEISNWRLAASGHAYFTLKDENSQIDAVMFRGPMGRVKFTPENGQEVLVHGQVTVYEKRGNYQIVLDDMQPRGMGALQLAFEQLKRKLEAEGLFDARHKKPLPMLPRRIGIVTSPTGAAIRDILHVIRRRFANVHILLWPARVQGAGAAAEIAEGIAALDKHGVDVMIVGRGGGSLEDLWAFNEEPVVRAVFAAATPVISAVGHEIDFTLTDFAADLRAPTPSAAAEMVVREQGALVEAVARLRGRLARAAGRHAERARNRLDRAAGARVFRQPSDLLRNARQAHDEARLALDRSMADRVKALEKRLEAAGRALDRQSPAQRLARMAERAEGLKTRLLGRGRALTERGRADCARLAAQLNALSPLAILARGYAAAWRMPERALVHDAGALRENDTLLVRFGRGAVNAVVTEIVPDGTDRPD